MEQLKILLADDHAVVRAGLKALIDGQADMRVVGEASDGAETVAKADECEPDVIVMDLSMPRLNGIEATGVLRQRSPRLAILILSVHQDATYLRRALEAGATGYVLKHAAPESLITAIRQVATGTVYLDPALSPILLNTVVGGSSWSVGRGAAMSEREIIVLRLIAQGYSNKEIASKLDLSVKTVETYKARAMEKLGISSRVEIVRYAAAQGWLNTL